MEANIFTRFEFKFPFLFYHACFDWPESVKRATLEALEAARSPATCPVLCPGSSGTLLLPAPGGHGNLVEQRLASLAPQAAAAYFGRLLEPHAVRLLQALVRGWLSRRRRDLLKARAPPHAHPPLRPPGTG